MSCKDHLAERLQMLLDGITGDPTTEGPPKITPTASDDLREAIRILRVCHGCAQCRMQERLDADPDACWARVPDPSTGGWRRCRLERSFHDGSRAERLDHPFVESDGSWSVATSLTRTTVPGGII